MKNRLIAITFVLASMLAMPTAMGAADLEINTPAIAAIQGSMQSRHGQLAPYYASGAVGLTRHAAVWRRTTCTGCAWARTGSPT